MWWRKMSLGGWRSGFKWLGEHSVFERVWVWFLELTSGSSLPPAIPGTWDLKKSSCLCGYRHLYAHTYTHIHIKNKTQNWNFIKIIWLTNMLKALWSNFQYTRPSWAEIFIFILCMLDSLFSNLFKTLVNKKHSR